MTPVEILLVEDNSDDAELAITALQRKHLANSLVHVEDGEEALEFLFAEGKFAERKGLKQPRLMLLDLKMPKVSGLEVLERIKSNPATATIPVVILTSSKEEPDIKKAYALGANSYIVKPVTFENFVEVITSVGMYWLVLNQLDQM